MRSKELLENAQALVKRDLAGTENVLAQVRAEFQGTLRSLGDHVLSVPGKRLRPTILLLSARLRAQSHSMAPRVAAVVELIHTATLIHDDSIDDAQLRRGQSTVNVEWNHQVATMLGDTLYLRAFELLTEMGEDQVTVLLARAAHTMSRGELREFLFRDNVIEEPIYLELIWSKTAAFMGACCHAGAILGRLEEAECQAIRQYGEKLGMAFQIVDDMLDYSANADRLGKETLTDLREGKMTLPLIAALQSSGRDGDFLKEQIQLLRSGELSGAEVAEFVGTHGGLHYARDRALSLTQDAKSCLSELPESEFRSSLELIADYVVKRER